MPKLSGYTFIGLNIVRGLSIVTLILLFSSSIVTMVSDIKAVNVFMKAGGSNSTTSGIDCSEFDCDYIEGSTVPNQAAGAFWAVLNRLLIIFQSIVLIMSEVGWPASFFDRFFPILGKDFGLGALGVIQCLLGAAVLSHHVDKFSLVSAFFLFSIGCVNIFLGLVFREKAKRLRSLAARDDDKDVLPIADKTRTLYLGHTYTGSSEKESTTLSAARSGSTASSRAGMGFGRQGEKAAAAKGFFVQPPEESVPPYAPKPKSHFRASSPVTSSSPTAV
ncbi:hypothetical protein NLI96_g4182 [Meripilus lineatus]|uniref:DUF7598 domain-containing protein n=1 Tax=Meripilus lineatus TaxID=2056292 RepID=A0AAD5VAQ0_9APHY|nr:hypothetical protein NLI96_g4182 [Physisporinus lineatus]